MWKPILMAVVATVVVVLTVQIKSTREAGKPPIVEATAVTPDRIYAAGRVEGQTEQMDLRTEIPGRVAEVLATEGDQVTAGQLLLRLDDRQLQQQVRLAESELASAQARLERLMNGPTAHELAEAEAAYQVKWDRLQHLQLTWDRISRLEQADAIAGQSADDQRSSVTTARSELAAAQAHLQNLRSQPRADDVKIAQAEVATAAARLESMRVERSRTRLEAPIAGHCLRVNVRVGEIADPHALEPLLSMVDLSQKTVRAFVEELDAPRVRPGMRATVTADGLAGREYTGTVARVSPMMGPKKVRDDRPQERLDTKTREVWIELTDPADELIFGLRVDVYFEVGASPPRTTKPSSETMARAR